MKSKSKRNKKVPEELMFRPPYYGSSERRVKAIPIELKGFEKIPFYRTWYKSKWYIFEKRTTLTIGRGKTIQEAIDNSLEHLMSFLQEELINCIADLVKNPPKI